MTAREYWERRVILPEWKPAAIARFVGCSTRTIQRAIAKKILRSDGRRVKRADLIDFLVVKYPNGVSRERAKK